MPVSCLMCINHFLLGISGSNYSRSQIHDVFFPPPHASFGGKNLKARCSYRGCKNFADKRRWQENKNQTVIIGTSAGGRIPSSWEEEFIFIFIFVSRYLDGQILVRMSEHPGMA